MFPRARARGLIEANFACSAAASRKISFPRARARGLIEAGCRSCHSVNPKCFRERELAASLKRCAGRARPLADARFRERELAASLKRDTSAGVRSLRLPFPRARARGLIEARD